MEEIILELDDQEYITLVNALKISNVLQSGGQIKYLLENESIKINDVIAFQKKKKCFPGDVINVDDQVVVKIK